MKIQCPECGVTGSLDDAHAGKRIRCPKCKAHFVAEDIGPASQEHARETDSASPPLPEETAAKEGGVSGDGPGDGLPPAEVEEVIDETGKEEVSQEQVVPPPITAEVETQHSDRERASAGKGREQTDNGDIKSTRIGDLLSKGWELTAGVKGPIWGGLAIMYGILFASGAFFALLIESGVMSPDGLPAMVFDLATSALSTVFTAGMMYMGVKRATDRPVVWKDIFTGFSMAGQVIVAMILQGILILIGFLLLILPGIYLAIGYGMTFALILDKGMTPWQAMEASRKAVHKVWWKMFGLYLIVTLIMMISAIPLGIGLIWTLPMSIVLYGVVYVALFGRE